MEYIGSVKKQGSIVDVLKEAILLGKIQGGAELTQNEIAQELEVSRMPVREALIILEYQGLMERLPNNHVRVTEFGDADFRETFRLCARLEMEALGQSEIMQHGMLRNGDLPDELAFHRSLYRSMTHTFYKKTLETLVEVYVAFAVRHGGAGKRERIELLNAAWKMWADSQPEQAECLFGRYFDSLAEIIRKVRARECLD